MTKFEAGSVIGIVSDAGGQINLWRLVDKMLATREIDIEDHETRRGAAGFVNRLVGAGLLDRDNNAITVPEREEEEEEKKKRRPTDYCVFVAKSEGTFERLNITVSGRTRNEAFSAAFEILFTDAFYRDQLHQGLELMLTADRSTHYKTAKVTPKISYA